MSQNVRAARAPQPDATPLPFFKVMITLMEPYVVCTHVGVRRRHDR